MPVGLVVDLMLVAMVLSAMGSHDGNDTERVDDELFANDDYAGSGTSKHAERLLQLSVEQSEEGLGKLLLKMDINNDGVITGDELTNWIIKSNDALEEKEANEYIHLYDLNNDSSMSWDEYFQHYYGSPTVDFATKNPDHKEILEFVETDKFRFQSADINKDGALNIKELKAFLHPHNYMEMLDYETKKIVKDYDLNNDSKINKEELKHFQYGEVTMNPLQKTRINRIFESYDSDKDGNLSFEEVKIWLKPDAMEYARTEAAHLIKVSDINNDSRLTKEEILEKMDHWMTSKATNFGDHIRDEL